MKTPSALLLMALTSPAFAAGNEIPLNELGFVDAIQQLDKASITEQLGEPQKVADVKDDVTGEVLGTTWQYQYLNTTEDGEYYKTTELDFVGDRVITVVFINNEIPEADTTARIPLNECTPTC